MSDVSMPSLYFHLEVPDSVGPGEVATTLSGVLEWVEAGAKNIGRGAVIGGSVDINVSEIPHTEVHRIIVEW